MLQVLLILSVILSALLSLVLALVRFGQYALPRYRRWRRRNEVPIIGIF